VNAIDAVTREHLAAIGGERGAVQILDVGLRQLTVKRCAQHDLGLPREALAGRRFTLPILALVGPGRIGPATCRD
jgi:hypothetical protein